MRRLPIGLHDKTRAVGLRISRQRFARIPARHIPFEVIMLDLFYIAIAIAFFVLLWGFTRASERL